MFKKIDTTGLLCLLASLYFFLEIRERFDKLNDADTIAWGGLIFLLLFFMVVYYANYGKEWNAPWMAKCLKICTLFPTWALLYDEFISMDIARFMAVVIAGAITMILAAFCFNNAEGK